MSELDSDGPVDAEAIEEYPFHRRFVRHQVRLQVDVQAERSYPAWTHNLSPDGLCFEIPAALPPGQEITVWIFLDPPEREAACPDAEGEPIQVRCRVVWRDTSPKGSRHGGQFLFFAADGQQRLAAWLESLQQPAS